MDSFRGDIDLLPNTVGNARLNELTHNVNQGQTKLGIHTDNSTNHLDRRIEALTDLVRTESATMAQLINMIHSLATQVGNLLAQQPARNSDNSSTSKPDQAPNKRDNNATTRRPTTKPAVP